MKIVILGPDGAGKSSVIQGLMQNIDPAACVIRMRHLKPRVVLRRGIDQAIITVDPHGKPPRSAIVSAAKIAIWLFEEWYANLFQDRQTDLLICDRYYHDLLVDPVRYRYGGPSWLARLVGRLMPQPGLWMLLDAPAQVLRERKQEVTPEETARQRGAYLDFIQKQKKYIIVDASQSLDKVIADARQAVQKMCSTMMLARKR